MDNNVEQDRTRSWQDRADSKIDEALQGSEKKERWDLELEGVTVKDFNNYMIKKFGEEFPSVMPSAIYGELNLDKLKIALDITGEKSTDFQAQALYFIRRGNNTVALLPLIKTKNVDIVEGHEAERTEEEEEKDKLCCYIFNQTAIYNNDLLSEKLYEVEEKLKRR